MTLKSKFAFLVGGISIVPLLAVMLAMSYFQVVIAGKEEPVPNYREVSDWLRSIVTEPYSIEPELFKPILQNRPPGLETVIFNKENKIILSTIEGFKEGNQAELKTILDYVKKNARSFHFQIDLPKGGENTGNLILLKLPRMRERFDFRRRSLEMGLYLSLVLLVFSSITSVLIVRSLNKSIQTLERATRQVAEGDLDFELTPRGSDEIASLTKSFDNMRNALKEEYAKRSRFIMGVSHDLKTPLALIEGYVEAISDGYAEEPEMKKKYLSIILEKTKVLDGMITDLIEFVKMETGEWRLTHKETNLKEFLSAIAKRYSEDALILKRNFYYNIDISDNIFVMMDSGLVSRALENIIGNAIRYTENEGTVEMNTGLKENEIDIFIRDTGIGIPPDEIKYIFDPFYRGTNSRREQGFGLGLSTAKSIIESHGWRIEVVSVEGQGTTFCIKIYLK
ncbi:MAG: HAMP domain-containing sensor histidine kinase [Spirochaetota bacterium]